MDYRKLNTDEIINILNFHRFIDANHLPYNWEEAIKTIRVEPDAAVATELVDLYIATSLINQNIQIPDELDMNKITPRYYQQLAPVLYLPIEFTPDNLERAKRIIRIIRETYNEKPKHRTLEIMPVVFTRQNTIGDFNWMIKQPQYDDVLFLFNDNVKQFTEFHNSIGKPTYPPSACAVGGGNAIIRPYQCLNPPRAAGIPTGDHMGGYQNLNKEMPMIQHAFAYIIELLRTGKYKRVAYSSDPSGNLGTAIFSPSKEVKDYIVANIRALANNPDVLGALH